MYGRHYGYVVWGISDKTHDVVGTPFDPSITKEQGQPLEFWLARRLRPSVNILFKEVQHPGGRVLLLEVPAATSSPVEFDGHAYIRIGSATPKLSDYPDRLSALWDKIRPYAWERGLAAQVGPRLVPRNEHIDKAFRTGTPLDPAIAIRELVANALIQQDLTITGTGPLIELFNDRLEITNPGTPLVNPDRFIDCAPRSRNEALAALMRRMRICEEQGTGIDKVVRSVELFQLPAPDFRAEEGATRVVLYAPRRFAEMTIDERVRACYQQAVLQFISGARMRNSTLRERLGIESRNAAQVSKIIRLALGQKLIRPADPLKPQAAYVPHWA